MLSPISALQGSGGQDQPRPGNETEDPATEDTKRSTDPTPPAEETGGSGDTTTAGPTETTRSDTIRLEPRVPAPTPDDASAEAVVEARLETPVPSEEEALALARASAEAYREQAAADAIVDRIAAPAESPIADSLNAQVEPVAGSLNPLDSPVADAGEPNQPTSGSAA